MLKSLKDLEKAIKLCRKLGVESIRIDGVEFHLGVQVQTFTPRKQPKVEATLPGMTAPGGITEDMIIPTTPSHLAATLTEEQLLFYSVGNEQ